MKKSKIITLAILVIMFVSLSIYLYKSNHNPVVLDEVVLKQEVNNKTFAMYTETDDGYKEYEGNSFPKGQRLNKSLSKCIDNNGEEIKDAINVENETGNISVSSNRSLLCYLYFDNKIEDLSGKGHNGINHAQLWTEEGITTSIDESNLGYVDCGLANYDFKDSITMITRLKFNNLAGGYQYFFGDWENAGGGLYLIYPSLTFDLYIDTSYKNAAVTRNFNLNTYYTMVGVYDGKETSIYIDGEKISSNQVSGNITPSSMPIFLGANPGPSGPRTYSYTTFTDALIFDTALSEIEIQKYFGETIDKEQILNEYVKTEPEKELLLYYKFN